MLNNNNTALILIDVQGKLAKIVHESEQILQNIDNLIQGVQMLNMPIIWMEQYPEGLGPTVDEIKQHLPTETPIAKKVFSACQSNMFQKQVNELNVENFLIVGIEAHICVYQTVLELIQDGKNVEVVVDAISSRTVQNKNIAIEKMKQLGAGVTSVEMVLFELLRTADHPAFKEISKLIK